MGVHTFPDVPLVGDAFTIVAHYPTVVVQCQCPRKGTVVLIGVKTPAPCPSCGVRYAILDDMTVRVGQAIGRPAADLVPQ